MNLSNTDKLNAEFTALQEALARVLGENKVETLLNPFNIAQALFTVISTSASVGGFFGTLTISDRDLQILRSMYELPVKHAFERALPAALDRAIEIVKKEVYARRDAEAVASATPE